MRIFHIVAGIQETCGVSQYVVNTARAQQAAGHEVTIVTLMTCGYPMGDLQVVLTEDPVEWLDGRREEVEKVGGQRNGKTVFHLHSMWNWYVHRVAVWCRKNKVPYVWSPHGSLTPWAMRYHWWKKLPAWWIYQRADMKGAAGFHVTVEEEQADVRRVGFRQPVVIAPLGSEVEGEKIGGGGDEVEKVGGGGDERCREVVFVGRIHPKKNIDGLIRAVAYWKKESTIHCPPTFSTYFLRLIIAGSDDVGWQKELVELAKSLGLKVVDFSQDLEFGKKQIHGGGEVPVETFQKRLAECDAEVIFTGPVYAAAKDWMYRHAWVSILPSHSENFGGVVVEALAQGTPVIASKGTPWQVLAEKGCGWWVETSVDGIAAGLQAALEISEAEREAMAERARALVAERYSWKASAAKVVELYERVERLFD